MAEDQGQEKTEQPTQRRFEKAAEEGQVVQSADFAAGLMMLTGTIFFLFAGTWFYETLTEKIKLGLSTSRLNIQLITDQGFEPNNFAANLVRFGLMELTTLILPLMVATFAIAFFNGALVTGLKITWKPLTPNFEKLDPIKGFKKIFSMRAVIRGVMAVTKVSAMSAVVYWLMLGSMDRISASCGIQMAASVAMGWQLTLQVALAIAAAMVLIGLADLLFQKWKHVQDLKMTRKELRDEHKENEGDPLLRARMRKLQREIGQRTAMLMEIPEASVIIRNPTHLAIALRFDRGQDNAPVVLAKGADALALKIIEIAEANKVPVIERKPIARALYAMVNVGEEIPLELYQAVAEILAYVSRQQSIVRRRAA